MKIFTKILTAILSITMLFSVVGFTACSNGELQAKIAELEAQITELQEQNQDLQADITDQQTQITTQQEQIEALEQENEGLQASVTEQQEQIKALEQEKQELEEEIEYLESQISENVVSGTFYSLEEAYQNGWLTQQDLMSIAYYHNGGREGNEEIMPEDYTPQTKALLNVTSQYSIKKTYQAMLKITYPNEHNDVLYNSIQLMDYFGTYNNIVVVSIYAFLPGIEVDLLYYNDYYIGDVKFSSYSPNVDKVWTVAV